VIDVAHDKSIDLVIEWVHLDQASQEFRPSGTIKHGVVRHEVECRSVLKHSAR
jgi:hypothetical protein